MSSSAGGELSEGTFENTFVKQDNIWKIQSVHFYPRMIVDAATGWAKSAKPAPGPNKEFPPDRPPTASYEIYPKFAVAPFHFDNPVTGKPPQYPNGVPATARPPATVPPKDAAIRNAAELAARLEDAERGVNTAEAYDAAENLLGAYSYYLDESPADAASLFQEKTAIQSSPHEGTIFVNQILQPVIKIARDGHSATVRARTLDLGGVSGGAGYWSAGTFEGQIVWNQGKWQFQTAGTSPRWSAPYPGGWARESR